MSFIISVIKFYKPCTIQIFLSLSSQMLARHCLFQFAHAFISISQLPQFRISIFCKQSIIYVVKMFIITSLHLDNNTFAQYLIKFRFVLCFFFSTPKLLPLLSIRLVRAILLSYPSAIELIFSPGPFHHNSHSKQLKWYQQRWDHTILSSAPCIILSNTSIPAFLQNSSSYWILQYIVQCSTTNGIITPLSCQAERCWVFDASSFPLEWSIR